MNSIHSVTTNRIVLKTLTFSIKKRKKSNLTDNFSQPGFSRLSQKKKKSTFHYITPIYSVYVYQGNYIPFHYQALFQLIQKSKSLHTEGFALTWK